MSRTLAVLLLLPLLAGCFGGDDPKPTTAAVAARAPAPATAGTLSQVPLGPKSERRLAYANLDRLGTAELPVPRARVLARVLGESVRGRGTLVRVGGDAPRAVSGTAPQTSAITPVAQSAAQSCLGDTLAQTLVGPGTLGRDNALGVGLAESGDAPAGIQLRICGAPRLIRHLHAMERRLERRFGGLGERARIEEREIGEREIVTGTIAAAAVPDGELLELLSGGDALRQLAWR